MRVLVIGGTAFIGRRTVQVLLEKGHEVTLFHRGRHPNPFGNRVAEVAGDRHDPSSIRKALTGLAFDGVIDIAYDAERGTGGEALRTMASEVQRSRPRYVLVSSAAVYQGLATDVGEDAPLIEGPPGSYPVHKAEADRALLAEHRAGHLTAAIMRPSYVHGPHNPIPREAWFWDRIVAGRPLLLPDDGRTLMHWSAVQDVAWALVEGLTNPAAAGEAFNIAEAEPVTHERFLERLAKVAGRQVEMVRVPRKKLRELSGSPRGPKAYFGIGLDPGADASLSIEKARRLLHFEPTDPLVSLGEAFRWYSAQERRAPPDLSFEDAVLAALRK